MNNKFFLDEKKSVWKYYAFKNTESNMRCCRFEGHTNTKEQQEIWVCRRSCPEETWMEIFEHQAQFIIDSEKHNGIPNRPSQV